VALVPKKAPSSVPNTSLARRSNSATRSRTLGSIYQRNGGSDQPSPRSLLDSDSNSRSLCLPIMPSERSADGDRRAK
jgi:hypothetical protein